MVDCDINKINSAINNNRIQHFNNYVFNNFFNNRNAKNTTIVHFDRLDKIRYWVIICENKMGGVENISVRTHVSGETLVLKVRRMSKEKSTSTSRELPSLCSLAIVLCPNFK